MKSIEEIKKEDLIRKNSLVVKATFVSVILAAVVDIAMKKELAVILSIIIAGGIGVGFVATLHYLKKFISIIPYLSIFIVSAVLFIIMENSVSPTAYFLIYFALATAAIYMERSILWLASLLGFAIITVFTYLNHDALPLETKNYVTIYLLYLLVTIILSFQLAISNKLSQTIVDAQLETEQLLVRNEEMKIAIQGNTKSLFDMIEQVKSKSHDSYQSSIEMNQSITELASGIQTQTDNITDITQALEQSNSVITHTTELVDKLHRDAIHTEQVTNNGALLVLKLKEDMSGSFDKMEKVNDDITSLSTLVSETSHFAKDIQEIAEQTNLLALNASIEAARAGESGKGFAVVADEVRKLADITRKTATQISENLNNVINDTERTKENVVITGQMITNNLNHAVDTEKAFQQIQETFLQLKKDIAEYDSLTKKIFESSNSIHHSVSEFSAVIEQSSASLQELSSTISLQTDQHDLLFTAVSAAHESVENLVELQRK